MAKTNIFMCGDGTRDRHLINIFITSFYLYLSIVNYILSKLYGFHGSVIGSCFIFLKKCFIIFIMLAVLINGQKLLLLLKCHLKLI